MVWIKDLDFKQVHKDIILACCLIATFMLHTSYCTDSSPSLRDSTVCSLSSIGVFPQLQVTTAQVCCVNRSRANKLIMLPFHSLTNILCCGTPTLGHYGFN